MDISSFIQQLSVVAIPILFAITLHEVAHGRAALYLGDTTAKMVGRLSLNPLKHVDPVGTVIVPLTLLFLGGFIFGWAKPVPVSMRNLRNPRRDMAMVALAGPMANMVMAAGWTAVLGIVILMHQGGTPSSAVKFFADMSQYGIFINVLLAVLNLLPFPPLDGSRLLAGVLPERQARVVDQIEPYGLMILVALMATGVLSKIIGPPIMWVNQFFLKLVY